MVQKVSISIDGKVIDLPVFEATEGTNVVDVRGLINEGIFTFDPGFLSTASCESRITYIDGEAGILMYRGYPIEQLANNSKHMEVCALLLDGELPDHKKLENFENDIKSRMAIESHFKQLFDGFTQQSHPMSMVCAAVSGLAALYHDDLDILNAEHRREAALNLIAKIPTMDTWIKGYSFST